MWGSLFRLRRRGEIFGASTCSSVRQWDWVRLVIRAALAPGTRKEPEIGFVSQTRPTAGEYGRRKWVRSAEICRERCRRKRAVIGSQCLTHLHCRTGGSKQFPATH